jgi:hypothetical protein
LKIFEFRTAEASKVVIEDVDARDRPAGEMREERISREPFEVEDAFRSRDGGVDQKLHLGVHRIDDSSADLQVTEPVGS